MHVLYIIIAISKFKDIYSYNKFKNIYSCNKYIFITFVKYLIASILLQEVHMKLFCHKKHIWNRCLEKTHVRVEKNISRLAVYLPVGS